MSDIILTPEMGRSGGPRAGGGVPDVKYDYTYPRGLDLSPTSELHDKIKNRLMNNAIQSYSVMQRRHSSWNAMDDTLNVYIPADLAEQQRQAIDKRSPISIVVPQTFAVMETILTYFTMAFFQDPVFQFDWVGPEDLVGAKLLELVIDHQLSRSQGQLALHTMFRDSIVYGFGAVAASWTKEEGKRIVKDESFGSKVRSFIGASPKKKLQPHIFYEGSKLLNIDPYLILPDPNVPIHRAGEGDFFGWVDEVPYANLLDQESWMDSSLFNVRYLKHLAEGQSIFTTDASKRGAKFQLNNRRMMYGSTNCRTVVNMYVNLIPQDWGLGPGEYPEKWAFKIADGLVIIEARPLDLVHNRFPIVMSSPDYDGYSVAPISRLEILHGLQTVLDFLFNSHVQNVRRAVNNMFVVDPSLVNIPDFDNPTGGLLIRLRRAAWGRGVNDAVAQLQVADVTRGHVQDAMAIMDLGQKFSGAVESLMGVMRKGGERRSATEAKGTMGHAVNRMEKMAKLISIMALQPLAYMMAFHTQQLMSQDTYVNIVGDWTTALQKELGMKGKYKVSPMDLLVQFDVTPRDGSLPVDVQGQAYNWVQLWGMLIKTPQVAAQFDTVRIFKHIARLMGAKNVHEFEVTPEMPAVGASVQPDEVVAQQAQAGNLVPINQEGMMAG